MNEAFGSARGAFRFLVLFSLAAVGFYANYDESPNFGESIRQLEALQYFGENDELRRQVSYVMEESLPDNVKDLLLQIGEPPSVIINIDLPGESAEDSMMLEWQRESAESRTLTRILRHNAMYLRYSKDQQLNYLTATLEEMQVALLRTSIAIPNLSAAPESEMLEKCVQDFIRNGGGHLDIWVVILADSAPLYPISAQENLLEASVAILDSGEGKDCLKTHDFDLVSANALLTTSLAGRVTPGGVWEGLLNRRASWNRSDQLIWDAVKNLTTNEALDELRNRKAAADKGWTAWMNIEVAPKNLGFVFVFGIFAAALLLLAHLMECSRFTRLPKSDVTSYGCILFQTSKLAKISAIISAGVLPMIGAGIWSMLLFMGLGLNALFAGLMAVVIVSVLIELLRRAHVEVVEIRKCAGSDGCVT